MMKAAAISMLLIGALGSSITASTNDLEYAVAKKYAHTIMILRHPVDSNRQKYTAAGELLSGGSQAPWTIDGAIEVNKIHITPAKLTIEAKRRVYGFDLRQNQLLPLKMKEKDKPKIDVEISLDSPLSSMEQVDAIIHRIFADNEGELIDSVPPYWRSFLVKQYSAHTADASQPRVADSTSPKAAADDESNFNAVKLDPRMMTPPRAVYTPEPDYSEWARHMRFQGTVVLTGVVDITGKVRRVQIVRPTGFGLDERALEVVQNWKFKPAIRDGKPIAVEMAFEIAFKLY